MVWLKKKFGRFCRAGMVASPWWCTQMWQGYLSASTSQTLHTASVTALERRQTQGAKSGGQIIKFHCCRRGAEGGGLKEEEVEVRDAVNKTECTARILGPICQWS